MPNLEQNSDTFLQQLDDLMLPASLEEAFEAYRFDLLRKVCESQNENQLSWYLHEINQLHADAEPAPSFSETFDPFLRLHHGTSHCPPSTLIVLPPLPSTIVRGGIILPSALLGIVEGDIFALGSRLEMYEEAEVNMLARIATAALVDQRDFSDRKSAIEYIATNASQKLKQSLLSDQSFWSSVPRRQVEFPDMVSERRKQLASCDLFNPPLSENELECFADEEIREQTRDIRVMALSPKIRHLSFCRSCLNKFARWQTDLARFHQLAENSSSGRYNA